ncbi:hypothetical protein LXL04_033869 [Taraxacum kok-saghyz]
MNVAQLLGMEWTTNYQEIALAKTRTDPGEFPAISRPQIPAIPAISDLRFPAISQPQISAIPGDLSKWPMRLKPMAVQMRTIIGGGNGGTNLGHLFQFAADQFSDAGALLSAQHIYNMSNIAKLEFAALKVTGKNYMPWIMDVKMHLQAQGIQNTINKQNEYATHKKRQRQ